MERQSFTVSHQQCGAPASLPTVPTWGKQLPSFLLLYLWTIPWPDWVRSPHYVPSQLFDHPQTSHCGCRVRNREGLDNAQRYSVH